MNAIQHEPAHDPTVILNAIVFSNFPDSIFNGEILDKLLKHHVHVIQVYKPDRVDAAVADVSKADAVISFVDFMSHPQDELIRKKARAWKKPIASLRRQSSDWPKLLADVMPKPSVAEAAPPDNAPESLPSSVKQVMNTFMSLTKSGVSEDEILQAVRAVSDFKDLAQVEDMFERYVKTASAPLEFQAWWRDHQKPRPLPAPPAAEPSTPLVLLPSAPRVRPRRDMLPGRARFNGPFPKTTSDPENVPEDVTALKKKLKETQEMSQLYEEENKALHDELRSLVDTKVRAEVEQHVHEWTKKIQQFEKEKAEIQARLCEQVNALDAEKARCRAFEQQLASARTEFEKQLVDAQQAKERMHGVAKAAEKKLETVLKQSAMLDEVLKAEKAAREAAEKKLVEAQANKAGSSGVLDTIAMSVRSLYEAGFLNREEVGEKFANHVLKDSK